MDTVVDIQVVTGTDTGTEERNHSPEKLEAQIDRAFDAFRHVEQACSRFSPDSELMRACRQIAKPVRISPFLFEPLKLALHMAECTDGLFNPTVGKRLENYGFNRHYLTQQCMNSAVTDSVNYRDIVLDESDQTLLLHNPMVIDLGAVAKGFAIDLAAHELQEFDGFIVNAGGDIYAGGVNEQGKPWEVSIQHPTHPEEMIYSLTLSDQALCTSGSYERRSAITEGVHHLIDPITGRSPETWISCSVIAPYAMMADVFSSAVMLQRKEAGLQLIHQTNVQAILITPDLQVVREGGIKI
ncbi:FAD:protein FMN transferase [Paenibacillus sp. FSL R5-0519]|uniref:FAD:protein FMN transferase n=1 Tax=Paenibacillus sp. FSL R5-0519 TaxID=2921648 RepID=UPI0030D73A08